MRAMDDAQRWSRIEALFDAAVELDPTARAAFLARECPDPILRTEVERLLHAERDSDGFLEDAAGAPPQLAAGSIVGE